jgi:RecA-family ATPase
MFQFHDVTEYVTQAIPHPPFVIQDLLPQEGAMLIYGAPGVMKSFVAQHQGFSVSAGIPWLGFRTTQARTALINFEISVPTYHDRLVRMATQITAPQQSFYVATANYTYINEDLNFIALMEALRLIQPQHLILDCMSGFFGGDENSGVEMSALIAKFILIREEFHCSMTIIHHSNKNLLTLSPMDRARGHSKLTGWVDTILYMIKQPTGVQIQFGKTRHAMTEIRPLNIVFQNNTWHLANGVANGTRQAEPIQTFDN